MAQVATYRFPYEAVPNGTYPASGQQFDYGFCLDYNSGMFIRKVQFLIIGWTPNHTGIVTLCPSVPPGAPATLIASCSGTMPQADIDFGRNGFYVPAAQALSLEWSATGGGNRTLMCVISYTANEGPNP